MSIVNWKKVNKYEIFVGVHSIISKNENEYTEYLEDLICKYLYDKKVDFSISYNNGGYTYYNGQFISEKGFHIYFIEGNYDLIIKICNALKMLLEQETILLLKRKIEVMYI